MIDIIVSFDTTGSMYPCLTEVRRKVETFIHQIFTEVSDVRLGLIAHGDYCDYEKPYITKYEPLTSDRDKLVRFIKTVEKTSGGDSDECYELVLQEALEHFKEKDRGAKKILILIADADPHSSSYTHRTYHGGNYYTFSATDWKVNASALVDYGVSIYPVQCLSSYERPFYKHLAKVSKTQHLRLHQFSNVIQLLTAVVYKQVSDDKLKEYGQQLETDGLLNRNLAAVLNLLLDSKDLIGGVELAESNADLNAVHPARFQVLEVEKDTPINVFVRETGAEFKIGRGFYQLTKPELVQERKEVVLRDKSGDMFSGDKAREMIGLPYGVRGKVNPRNLYSVRGSYEIFIQSTSATRKLLGGTKFLYETNEVR